MKRGEMRCMHLSGTGQRLCRELLHLRLEKAHISNMDHYTTSSTYKFTAEMMDLY